MAFHVGQKVVCVQPMTTWVNLIGDRVWYEELKKGDVYTVRALEETDHGNPGIKLVEVLERMPPPHMKHLEMGDRAFSCIRFRPLQEQGMSILRAILADPKVKIKETA